jgi:hypothetical protein
MEDALEDVVPRLRAVGDKHATAVARLIQAADLPDELAAAARASREAATTLQELCERLMVDEDY